MASLWSPFFWRSHQYLIAFLFSKKYIYNTVAYLSHARTVESRKQLLLSNTRATIEQEGYEIPFLGNGTLKMSQRATMENVSVDENYSFLLGSSQRANELAG
jgi:hypothetical protein